MGDFNNEVDILNGKVLVRATKRKLLVKQRRHSFGVIFIFLSLIWTLQTDFFCAVREFCYINLLYIYFWQSHYLSYTDFSISWQVPVLWFPMVCLAFENYSDFLFLSLIPMTGRFEMWKNKLWLTGWNVMKIQSINITQLNITHWCDVVLSLFSIIINAVFKGIGD